MPHQVTVTSAAPEFRLTGGLGPAPIWFSYQHNLVLSGGYDPPTLSFVDLHSIQLSYESETFVTGPTRRRCRCLPGTCGRHTLLRDKIGSPVRIQTGVARVRDESTRSLYDRAKLGSGRENQTLVAGSKGPRPIIERSRCAGRAFLRSRNRSLTWRIR